MEKEEVEEGQGVRVLPPAQRAAVEVEEVFLVAAGWSS